MPGIIGRVSPGPYWDYFNEAPEVLTDGFKNEHLRFYDYYLKGVDNQLAEEPPVALYVMNGGSGFRYEHEWPLGRQQVTGFHFNDNNSMSKTTSASGGDQYVTDYSHDFRDPATGATRWNISAPAVIFNRTDSDTKSLTYTTETLSKDMEVTGHPIVHLSVSSSADYGDFFVYLEDVDQNGQALLVTDGQLRAGFAGLLPNEDMLSADANLDALPDLPWHGYRQSDYVDGILANGNIVDLTFDLMPTSWVYKAGHKIRVSITTSDYPTFGINPALSPSNDPASPDTIVPIITVHRSEDHPSFIELPVIPSTPTSYTGKGKLKLDDTTIVDQSAQLHVFQNAVYLLANNAWYTWKVVDREERENKTLLTCEGTLGSIRVEVKEVGDGKFKAEAHGDMMTFSTE